MRKVKALVKYDFINIKRGRLIWVIAALYLFGIQQAISSMYPHGSGFISVVGLIEVSWLPLNFIMIPLLILIMKVGQNYNEIFENMDISAKEELLSKALVIGIVDGVLFLINLMILIVVGIISKVTLGYFLYESIGYVVNSLIFLMVCSAIGLFIGQVIAKYLSDIIGYIAIILVFLITCNFYSPLNAIVPVIDIRTFPGVFDVISYDKSYLLHNTLWILISLILLFAHYCFFNKSRFEIKSRRLYKGFFGVAIIFCVIIGIFMMGIIPEYYDPGKRSQSTGNTGNTGDNQTYFSEEDCGYHIDRYVMKGDIDNELKNDCNMKIKIDGKKVDSLELGLFKSLKINEVKIDGKEVSFERTNNSFKVKLSKEYKADEVIDMDVSYEGKINTMWLQGKELLFVRNNALYLGGVFEWYPKLNDDKVKEYDVKINYASKNKLYTNLSGQGGNGEYHFLGKDREIFLESGNLAERKYKDYLFIGNEEYINNDSICDEYIQADSNHNKKIVLSPSTLGSAAIESSKEKSEPYDNAVLFGIEN